MATPLDSAKYVNVETFRKDGSGVKTPVWAASLGGKLVFGTDGSTYKVKRIRSNPRVRVAACNASGAQILGPWYEGKARLLEGSEAARADAALDAKYGLQRRGFTFFAKLFGRIKDPVLIEIELTADGQAGT
ncbi:MAG: PPOX class F420-dependent oxidoreductase [Polyangia bacterium]